MKKSIIKKTIVSGMLISISFLLTSCIRPVPENPVENAKFTFGLWLGGNFAKDESEWQKQFEKFRSAGITDLYISGSVARLTEIAGWARGSRVNIHAWVWTLNRPGDEETKKHPEWYAVNRLGENSLEFHPYVDYYQWLSPFVPEAREHIKNIIRGYSEIPGIESVHLDYVRYCDVILGADLQPKYGLNQDRQMPEYDFGYHPIAREKFKELFGIDPAEMEHPELSTEWLQFRLNSVTSLVNEIAEIVHSNGKKLTAAVFPFPEMSRQMVRQDWSSWNLDAALPMMYHNFYRQPLDWIKFATEQGVRESKNMFAVKPGLFLPALSDAELEKAIRLVKSGGARGVTLFGYKITRGSVLKIVKDLNREINGDE